MAVNFARVRGEFDRRSRADRRANLGWAGDGEDSQGPRVSARRGDYRSWAGLTAARTGHPDRELLGDIAGYGSSVARRGRRDQSNVAKREIPRPSAYSGCRLFEREEPTADGCNHFRLAANYPALRTRCREIGKDERAAVGPENILPWAGRSGHAVLALRKSRTNAHLRI